MERIVADLVERIAPLHFKAPVTHVYNPLVYARNGFFHYWRRYGQTPKEVLLLGMNPGPWGMAQTGVPFGDVDMVTGWLHIAESIGTPARQHPKRPIAGFECPRGEVSGKRLWGWAKTRFKDPERFFKRFWVANYCPLVFMERSGRNRTPDKLPKDEKIPLFAACDDALRRTVDLLKPGLVVGVGLFAFRRAQEALASRTVRVGRISHPSPANPKANRGWDRLVEAEFKEMGVAF